MISKLVSHVVGGQTSWIGSGEGACHGVCVVEIRLDHPVCSLYRITLRVYVWTGGGNTEMYIVRLHLDAPAPCAEEPDKFLYDAPS